MDELTEEEKYRVTLQVDHFIDLLSKRYGIQPAEVVEAFKWVKNHQSIENKLSLGATFSVIGVLVGALMMALWEGIRHFLSDRGM